MLQPSPSHTGKSFTCAVYFTSQLSVRGKNKKEKISGFFKSVTQSADEVLLSNQKDVDDFFDQQRTFLVEYHSRIKDATMKADKMTKSHKSKFYGGRNEFEDVAYG